mmetsp:Transcript_26269/g.66254  ORF Transcript_26269/g.66254 Transcript_26269/m.66254 type:complete len:115 (-) Transcript_26269:157-501(-)
MCVVPVNTTTPSAVKMQLLLVEVVASTNNTADARPPATVNLGPPPPLEARRGREKIPMIFERAGSSSRAMPVSVSCSVSGLQLIPEAQRTTTTQQVLRTVKICMQSRKSTSTIV